jgi:hypothetical protein
MQTQPLPLCPVDVTAADANPPFGIVALYDSIISLMQARSIRCRLATEFCSDVNVESSFWFHALLVHPSLRQQAAAEAAKAEMVIVSVSDATALTPHLMDWLEQWLPARQGQSGALVALLDHRQGSEGAAALMAYLRQRAKDFNLDFFGRLDQPEASARAILPMPTRAGLREHGLANSLIDSLASESRKARSLAVQS